jgi:hypothetical protein
MLAEDLDTNKLNSILNYLLDNPTEQQDQQIAIDLQMDEKLVDAYLNEVKAVCPDLIEIRDEGNGILVAEIQISAIEPARRFLAEGGFNRLARAREQQNHEIGEKRKLKIRNLAATALAAERAVRDSKSAKTIAIIALVVSCVSAALLGLTLISD